MMHSGFGYARRRRRAAIWRGVQLALALVLVSASAAYAYRIGVSASEARNLKLKSDLEQVRADNLTLRQRLASSLHAQEQAEAESLELKQRLHEEVPIGAAAALMEEVRRQLDAGVEPDRLAFLIGAASRPASCAGEPEVKRFAPKTRVHTDPVSAVRFDGRIVVTARGEPVLNEEGLPEAWFDPAQPVTIDLQTASGEVVRIEDVLPIQHSMAVDGREYRFTVIAGERSYIEVSAQACALPDVDEATNGRSPADDPSIAEEAADAAQAAGAT